MKDIDNNIFTVVLHGSFLSAFVYRQVFHTGNEQEEQLLPEELSTKLNNVYALSPQKARKLKRAIVLYNAGRLVWRKICDFVYEQCAGCYYNSLGQRSHTCLNLWSDYCLKQGFATECFDLYYDLACANLNWSELEICSKQTSDLFDLDVGATQEICSSSFWKTRGAMKRFKEFLSDWNLVHALHEATLPFYQYLHDIIMTD